MTGALVARSAQFLSPHAEMTTVAVRCHVRSLSANDGSSEAIHKEWRSFGAHIAPTGLSSCASSPDLNEGWLAFRRYQLVPGARMLLLGGKPVRLGSRAFDLLHILLRSRGRLVSKEEIVRYVWPHTTVEESNLRFQMGCLRKALGRDRDLIMTIPGRGYVFATELPIFPQSAEEEFSQGG